VLSGKVAYEDAPNAILSWLQHDIYLAAVEVRSGKTKEARRKMLGKVPEGLRGRVEMEVRRIWNP
jgi:hypothetical protein